MEVCLFAKSKNHKFTFYIFWFNSSSVDSGKARFRAIASTFDPVAMDGAEDADDDWLSGSIEKYLTQFQGDRIDRLSTPLHASTLTITQSLTVARSSTVSLKFHR